MPPLFRQKLDINQPLLDRMRELPARHQRNLRRRLVTEVGPKLQKTADDLALTLPPEQAVHPFVFGSAKSYWYYRAAIIGLDRWQKGGRYLRTGDIESSFVVRVSDRFRMTMVTVTNTHPKAKYVYGPWAVQGHINTGWPRSTVMMRRVLRQYFIELVAEANRAAWRDAKRGEG